MKGFSVFSLFGKFFKENAQKKRQEKNLEKDFIPREKTKTTGGKFLEKGLFHPFSEIRREGDLKEGVIEEWAVGVVWGGLFPLVTEGEFPLPFLNLSDYGF